MDLERESEKTSEFLLHVFFARLITQSGGVVGDQPFIRPSLLYIFLCLFQHFIQTCNALQHLSDNEDIGSRFFFPITVSFTMILVDIFCPCFLFLYY